MKKKTAALILAGVAVGVACVAVCVAVKKAKAKKAELALEEADDLDLLEDAE